MKKALTIFFLMNLICTGKIFSQSMNCATATQINLTNGAACVNGTNVGAITDNTLYGACNATPVDMVWYTYVANGSNNTFTVNPGTLQNAEIVIYQGNCPASGGALQNCVTATGSNAIHTNWGMTAGAQVWIGIASTSLADGTFQFCVNSQPPVIGAGNTCAQAIPICSTPFVQNTVPSNSSGQTPSCFGSAPQEDIFIKFTVTQAGVLAWTAVTNNAGTEFDWCLWDVTAGCPGTEVCCNYNYAGGSSAGFGMQNSAGNAPCGTNAFGTAQNEFSPTMNVTCGKVYAIQISNYSNDNTGFTLNFTNSTCMISSNAAFSVNPTLICGASLTAAITNTSTGACGEVWSFGDGSANYTGTAPPNHTYNTPGTYPITATIAGACPSSATHFVQLLAPLAATVTATNTGCGAGCTGTASVTAVTGGDGIYTYSWSPGGNTTSTLSNLCAGSYTATVSNAVCGTSVSQVVNVVSAGGATMAVNSAAICSGDNTTLTANGCTTYTWSPATGLSSTTGASVTANPTTTTVYTITGANGSCTATATSTVTVNPTPTVTVNNGVICNGGSATLTANGAATYAWSPPGGLSATTGATVTANPAATTVYTVTGTSGTCTSTATSTVSVVTNPTVTVNSASICNGQQTATLTANGAITYAWTPATGLSATTGSVVTANPATTTVYTITGSAGTCTATGTSTVTVNALPTVTVNSSTICMGQQTATLTANAAISYTWTPAATLSSPNGSPVTATPTTTTSYTVTGTDGNGCTNSATSTVTVNSIPIVTLSGALICSGGSTPLTAGGAATYTWTPATGLSSTNGANVNANPATTTSYTVLGTDVNGCINGDSATVTVVSNPIVTATTGTICVGQQTTTLTASGANTYIWSPATGLSTTTGSVVTAAPANTTVYTITGTIGTCTASGTTTVTVNPLPTPTIGSDSPVCLNQTLNLNAGGAFTYTWSGPNTFTSTAQNPSIAGVSAAAAGTYTVVVTDANSCVNSATINVVINSLPIVVAQGSTVCLNSTITLTASGGTLYSWSGPIGYSSNQQNPTIPNATNAMAGSYVVTVTDANNCVNANIAQVVVNPLPTITANSAAICLGQQTATLTANGANTYAWNPVAGLSASTGSVVTSSPATTTQYTVTGTDGNNCQNTATLTVTVNPLPLVSIGPQAVSGCAPICVNFTNTAAGSGSCSWNFGNGNTSNSCAPNHCFNTQGTYSISLTLSDNNGCTNSSSAFVTVFPVPHADFAATPQPTTILDNTIHFYDLSTGAMINTWNWSLGNGTLSVVQNPTTLYADTGTYQVELLVISNHGCRDSTIKYVKIDPDYSLYVPNAFSPNSDGTNDVFYAKGEGVRDFRMYIFDRWGNQVFYSDDLYRGWDGRFMAKGDQIVQEDVYVWKIECKNGKGERKQLSGHVSLLK
jgi:gliding motility-associated-like protein